MASNRQNSSAAHGQRLSLRLQGVQRGDDCMAQHQIGGG
jgi:hypothetical protein